MGTQNDTTNQDNNQEVTDSNNSAEIVEKLKAMEARVKELEAKKIASNEKKQVLDDTKSKTIEDARIRDLEGEIEALKNLQDIGKEKIIETAKKSMKLEQMLAGVEDDKKELLSESLKGKVIDEQIAFLEKHKNMFLVPDISYKGNSGANNNNDKELDKLMQGEFIKEAGLTKDEVSKYLKEDDIVDFEKKLLRKYRGIRTADDVFNFFK